MRTSIPGPAAWRRPRPTLALGLVALLAAAPPSHAGIMDSIGGMFSKLTDGVKSLFGGGSKKSGDNAEFEKFLTQLETSQEQLFQAQTETINYYNENASAVNIQDAKAQELLNAVSDASRSNEDLYIQYLKVRGELVEQKVDVAAYKDRMDAIQANQKKLEEGFQSIQDFNKESGLLEPPPASGATLASASPGTGGAFDPDDPMVRRYIDEWLTANGLDGYGRQVGVVAGGRIRANYDADTGGRTRHRYVWEEYWSRTERSGDSLFQYVTGRLGGGAPAGPPPATQEPIGPTVVQASAAGTQTGSGLGGGFDPTDAAITTIEEGGCAVPPCSGQERPSAPETAADATLRSVTSELNQAVRELQVLQGKQEGNSPAGRALLEKVRSLQARRDQLLSANR